MNRQERLQHHYNEMIEWAEGKKSFHNLQFNGTGEAAQTIAIMDMCEVQKHAAVVMAIAALERVK